MITETLGFVTNVQVLKYFQCGKFGRTSLINEQRNQFVGKGLGVLITTMSTHADLMSKISQ